MAEVNEQLVELYIKVEKKWLYMSDIQFVVPGNYSNIDILAYNPKKEIYYDFEVKYRSRATFRDKDKYGNEKESNTLNKVIKQFTYKSRTEKIESIIGKNKKCIKIFVTTRKAFGSENKKNSLENKIKIAIKKHKFTYEIWYIENMIKELYENLNIKGSYNNEFLQTIRLIKKFTELKK